MIEKMITDVASFFITHSKLIIGAIVNLILIYVFCKVADAFNWKPDCLDWNINSVSIHTTCGKLLHSYILGFLPLQ